MTVRVAITCFWKLNSDLENLSWMDVHLHHNKLRQLALCFQPGIMQWTSMIAQAVIAWRFMIHTATKPLEAAVILLYTSSVFVDPVQCVMKPMFFTWAWKWAEAKRPFSLRPRGKFWNVALLYIYILCWKSTGWWDWTQTAYTHTHMHTQMSTTVCLLCAPPLLILIHLP